MKNKMEIYIYINDSWCWYNYNNKPNKQITTKWLKDQGSKRKRNQSLYPVDFGPKLGQMLSPRNLILGFLEEITLNRPLVHRQLKETVGVGKLVVFFPIEREIKELNKIILTG